MEAGIVIVGAGQAGGRAAQSMRRAGFAGAIAIVGMEPHPPYERPKLSKQLIIDREHPVPYVLSDLEALDVQLLTGTEVVGIDRASRRLALRTGKPMDYGRLLLATGCRARVPVVDGVAPDRILPLRSLDDCRRIEAGLRPGVRVCVIGGGFIGLEVAASIAARGGEVAVIEAGDRLLPRLGCREASDYVLAHHRAAGVDVRVSTQVVHGDDGTVTLSDGTTLPADVIVAGIGVMPNDGLATGCGLEVDDGVVVDAYGRTSDAHIFAAGDVTRHFNPLLDRSVRLESWENANLQAECVGLTMVGRPTEYASVPWLWSDQGSLNLQAAGAPLTVDDVVIRGGPDEGLTAIQVTDGLVVGGVTLDRARDMPVIRRLIEAQGLAMPVAALRDPAIPLRRFVPAREAA